MRCKVTDRLVAYVELYIMGFITEQIREFEKICRWEVSKRNSFYKKELREWRGQSDESSEQFAAYQAVVRTAQMPLLG